MGFKERYDRGKEKLLNDKKICKENRELFNKFFKFEEYKLKRTNGLPKVDERSYKTLSDYVFRLRNVNKWLKNKAWKDLTKADIKKFYDDFEDGKIKGDRGNVVTDKVSYYNKILRSKPFALAGKVDLVKEVMEFSVLREKKQVRFIEEETFRKLVDVAITPEHKAMLWLCWDIGENISSILELRKKDCVRRIDGETKQTEYIINLRKEVLKRSRTARSEPTNYPETVKFLDIILQDKKDNDLLFNFGHRQANKIIDRVVAIVGAKTIPSGEKVTLKDLRSSMSCHLLKEGWSLDEVNSRLGHSVGSKEIGKYVNYLALDKRKPKKKLYDNQILKLTDEIEKMKEREKLKDKRFERLQAQLDRINKAVELSEG